MWRANIGGRVDGVISFDPVALSYLLKATGPVKIGNGETITSDNAVSYLLHRDRVRGFVLDLDTHLLGEVETPA